MRDDRENRVLFCHKYCSKEHPEETAHDLNAYDPCRNHRVTFTTSAPLNDIGNNRNEFIPLEMLLAGKTLTSAGPERAFYVCFHNDTTETPDTSTKKEETESKE